jgi:hypothetical protein
LGARGDLFGGVVFGDTEGLAGDATAPLPFSAPRPVLAGERSILLDLLPTTSSDTLNVDSSLGSKVVGLFRSRADSFLLLLMHLVFSELIGSHWHSESSSCFVATEISLDPRFARKQKTHKSLFFFFSLDLEVETSPTPELVPTPV